KALCLTLILVPTLMSPHPQQWPLTHPVAQVCHPILSIALSVYTRLILHVSAADLCPQNSLMYLGRSCEIEVMNMVQTLVESDVVAGLMQSLVALLHNLMAWMRR